MWYDDYYDDDGDHWEDDNDEDKFFEWYDGFKKWKAQKANIKKELMPITWYHQGVGIGVCQKMKKKRQKNYGHKHRLFCI